MKIEILDRENMVSVSSICVGECFLSDGVAYMRTVTFRMSDKEYAEHKVLAVNLRGGGHVLFKPDEKVEYRPNAKVVI